MTVLIYGVHRESEPWAYDIAREVLSRNPSIIPIECPDHIRKRTDWIPVFNQYFARLREGTIERPEILWKGLSDFHHEIYGPVHEWDKQIARMFTDQRIFDLHGAFLSSDCGGNEYSSSVVAKLQFGYRFWTENSSWVELLASKHKLKGEGEISICKDTIEVVLPPDIPKYFGVNEDYLSELEEVVNQGPERPTSRDRIKIKSLRSWKGQFTPPTMWQAGSLLLPDTSSPRYGAIFNAAVDFFDDFFKRVDN